MNKTISLTCCSLTLLYIFTNLTDSDTNVYNVNLLCFACTNRLTCITFVLGIEVFERWVIDN